MTPKFESKPELTAVWPLIEGLTGIHPLSMTPTPLTPFAKGWMDHPDALAARDQGDVQIMIEETPQTLHLPGVASPRKTQQEASITLEPDPPAKRRYRKRTPASE